MQKQKQDNYKTGLPNFGVRPVLSNGFTLVELIVVITILAILGTIAIMAFSGYSKNARDSARLSDIGNMKKSLELWILQSGTYPNPTLPTDITYSGATVWTQGVYGDSVHQTVGKLDKKPLDPTYDIEYTYSVTNSKKEYQIGAVLEKDMAYNNLILPQTYAATVGEAYVSGTYNGILTTVGTNPTYVIALPSILISDTTTTELKNIATNVLVYEGQTNLPSSYKDTGLTMTGTEFSFTPTVVWSGASITNLNNQAEFQKLVENMQIVYTNNTVFTSLPEYTNIVSEGEPTVATMNFVKELVQTNTNTELTNISTNYLVQTVSGACTGIPTNAKYFNSLINYSLISATNGTSLLASYNEIPSQNTCQYKCDNNYSGTTCETYTPPWTCGDNLSIIYNSINYIYATKIGVDGKCWTSNRMKHGNKLLNPSTMPSDTNIIEKWCYNDDDTICNSDGGLYTWAEAMGFSPTCVSTSCNQSEDITKSVCGMLGSGWHLPLDTEWTNFTTAGANGWTGNKLDGIISNLSGMRHVGNYYYWRGTGYAFIWSSSQESSSAAKIRQLYSSNNSVGAFGNGKEYGYSVVCVKD